MKEKKVIDSRYQIEKKIGSGGSSDVFLCTHLKLNMQCAIKVINKNHFIDGKKEALLLRDLKHDKIPRIIDITEDNDNFYIIREFCDGSNLRESLNKKGPMSYDEIQNVANQIASVLEFFHSHNPPIIYRDLKPENIIIDKNFNIKLIDLGISRKYDSSKVDDTRYIGSRKYAAPEQFGLHQSTIQTDIYAFGLLLYFLYTAEDYVDVNEKAKWNKFVGNKGKKLKIAILKAINIECTHRQKNIGEFISTAFVNKITNMTTLPLKEKTTYNKNVINFNPKINIAFMGIQNGIGTSHISLIASKCFANLGYSVKLFDYSNKGGLENLYAFNKGYDAFEKSNISSFKYNGFEIITKNNQKSLVKMLGMDYEIGIFDFGSAHRTCNDFLKMQTNILILPSNPYAIKENSCLLNELLKYSNIKFLINLKNDKYKEILDYMNISESKGYGIGFLNENKINKEEQDFFIDLCKVKDRGIKKQGFIKQLFA